MTRSSAKKTLHRHGCTRCRQRYEDNCLERGVNGLCFQCRTGKVSFLTSGWVPRECCYAKTRLARPDERKTYDCAGDAPWFICDECKRTQIYKPDREFS